MRAALASRAALPLLLASLACSRAPTPPPRQDRAPAAAASPVPAIAPLPPASVAGQYMGRPVAPPMSYLGADWLDRPNRDEVQQPEHVLDVIGVKAGDVVADVGAGSGYFTEHLAQRVGPSGHVIATDVQQEMLALIGERMKKKPFMSNVETRLATATETKLDRASVDVVLMVDVYHELAQPDLTLAQIKTALRPPNGRLVLVEYRAEDPKVAIKPEHKMTLAQIKSELAKAKYEISKIDESLPEQRIVIAR